MNLNAPTNLIFIISAVLAILGVVAKFVTIPFVSVYAFWIVVVAFVLLAAGNIFKGL